ncbi:MAG: 6-carboxytetrahydropterin synthase QueD [Deltaproteobacteria bacterium]|nr:MAG: 6-carboxytetrahydropterin synthase QueD [Deltaproteobacteria bacterium]
MVGAVPVSTTIACDVGFESAHRLPHVPAGHKCARLHGHSFRCEIHVRGEVDPQTGWVQDYAELRGAFEPLRQQLDHYVLNDVAGLENPTSENLARWIWTRLRPALSGLCAIVVHETCTCRCTYTGED